MRKQKEIKVNYLSSWGENGTHYDQNITIDRKFIKYINKNIKYYHNSNYEIQETIADSVGFSTYYDCYLKEIDTTQNSVCLNITQLHFIYYYLAINNYDTKRIKERNTKLKMI